MLQWLLADEIRRPIEDCGGEEKVVTATRKQSVNAEAAMSFPCLLVCALGQNPTPVGEANVKRLSSPRLLSFPYQMVLSVHAIVLPIVYAALHPKDE